MTRLAFHALGMACALLPGFAQDSPRPLGWVVIPIQEYGTLRGKAFPVDREPESRTDATLTRVDYDLKIEGATATGRVTLTVDVLKDGWVRVPLPAGLLVREARVDGNRASLVPDPANRGQLIAALSKKGRSMLALEVAFALSGPAGQEQLTLPTAGAGMSRAAVRQQSPQDSEVRVTGGFLAEKSDTLWVAYGRGDEPLVLSWRRKIVEQRKRVELPLRMRGSLTQLFSLGEDGTALNAEVEVEVVQGAARQVKIAVPAAVTINQVPGALIADWDVKAGELIVNLLEPVEGAVKFAVSGEIRLARDGLISLPLLRLLDMERDSGGVAVDVQGAGEIKSSKVQALDEVDAAELGPMVAARQSPSLSAFRYRASGDRALQVEVARYTQQAVLTANVEEARYRALMSVDGKTLVQARYAVRNNQRTFARFTLPEGAVVWSASVAGHPVRPGKDPNGSLLLPLEKSRAGEDAPLLTVEILYLYRSPAWSVKGRAALGLPIVDLPISKTGVSLYYPPQFRVTPETGAFHSQSYEQPSDDTWGVKASYTVREPPLSNALVDNYRKRSETRRSAPMLPVRITFPAVGPSLYLVSELTGESKAAAIEVSYQKDKKK